MTHEEQEFFVEELHSRITYGDNDDQIGTFVRQCLRGTGLRLTILLQDRKNKGI